MYSCGKVLEKNWRLKRTPKTCFRKILIKQTIGQKYVQPSPPWCKETGKNIFGPGGGGSRIPSQPGGGGVQNQCSLNSLPPPNFLQKGFWSMGAESTPGKGRRTWTARWPMPVWNRKTERQDTPEAEKSRKGGFCASPNWGN